MELKQLRKNEKLTQKEFANKLNINIDTYKSIEQNRRKINLETLIKIADFYQVTLDYILDRKIKGIITSEEYDFINIYRQLDNNRKQQTLGFMKSELNNQNKEPKK